jgi:teichoic acid transport system permease protein
VTVAQRGDAEAEKPSELALLAARHGLTKVGSRPTLPSYVRSIWSRRAFLWVMASSRTYSRNQNNVLGQLWTVLNPLIVASVYLLVFGVILDTTGGTENYVGFVTVGIFIFTAIAASMTAGSTAITNNINVVRALSFPRAILPLSVALSEMLTLLPAIGVMIVIVLLSGESITWAWLLLPVTLAMVLLFSAGCSMLAARIVVGARDLRNLIPVAIRLLRYVSGVFFSIEHYVGAFTWGAVLEYQPVAVYLTLLRSTLLAEVPATPSVWIAGGLWAVLFFVVGFVVFWGAEEKYGRD